MRYFIEIAYNGKRYFGWQRQPNQISVQQVLEECLSTYLREDISVMGAGRTDTGVHAKQLFAHFECDRISDVEKFIFRINSFLPKDIAVKDLKEVKDDAHARFDAQERTYEYIIGIGKNPFLEDFAFQIYRKPDVGIMNNAAEILYRHINFKCFSRSKSDVKTYNCRIKQAFWEERGDTLVFTIRADRFLRNMVRAIVGTLLDVGFGKTSLEEFEEIIKSGSREEAGASAPAHALYLREISYPPEIFLGEDEKKVKNIEA